VLNATQLQVNGVNISSTYATQSALAAKQDSLTVISTNVPLFSGTTVRALAAGSNIDLSVASNVITVAAHLTNYALLTDLYTKQDTLLASATGTPLLNGSILRSISAGTNVALSLLDNNVAVSVPTFRGNVITATGPMTVPTSVFGGILNIAGTPPYTVTLPSPAPVAGAQFELAMNVNQVTTTTPVGFIGGFSGNV